MSDTKQPTPKEELEDLDMEEDDPTDEVLDPQFQSDGEDYVPKAKAKKGRPRNENYLGWEQAKEFMRSEMIPSRGKFFEWHDRHKPKAIPKFPYRVYKEWTTWNDFLGTNNKFNEKIGRKWRAIEEASLWVHKLKIESQAQWLEYCRHNELPEDIPNRPDLTYDNWRSWNHWLGNRPTEALELRQQAQKNAVYFIIHEEGVPGNVFTFGVEANGMSGMKERWEHHPFTVQKLFWYDQTKSAVIKQVIDALSSPYLDNERQRIVPNVFEVIWYLQVHLDTIRT